MSYEWTEGISHIVHIHPSSDDYEISPCIEVEIPVENEEAIVRIANRFGVNAAEMCKMSQGDLLRFLSSGYSHRNSSGFGGLMLQVLKSYTPISLVFYLGIAKVLCRYSKSIEKEGELTLIAPDRDQGINREREFEECFGGLSESLPFDAGGFLSEEEQERFDLSAYSLPKGADASQFRVLFRSCGGDLVLQDGVGSLYWYLLETGSMEEISGGVFEFSSDFVDHVIRRGWEQATETARIPEAPVWYRSPYDYYSLKRSGKS